jgi:hypothetical protein
LITLIVCLWVQTYEGGFGGEPGAEAHGGYSHTHPRTSKPSPIKLTIQIIIIIIIIIITEKKIHNSSSDYSFSQILLLILLHLVRYVFCAVAALALLGEATRIDMPALKRFLAGMLLSLCIQCRSLTVFVFDLYIYIYLISPGPPTTLFQPVNSPMKGASLEGRTSSWMGVIHSGRYS